MEQPAVATCENHAQREAIGVCVQCRRRVCSECSTKVEGINYCVSCLETLAAAGGRTRPRRGKRDGSAVSGLAQLLLYLGILWPAVWLMLEVLLSGGTEGG
ncbi:MAG: B-box zinc finger protein [Myxococcales bacterium]|nr:B-box zinc finger protein [Myxococcales bacterium]